MLLAPGYRVPWQSPNLSAKYGLGVIVELNGALVKHVVEYQRSKNIRVKGINYCERREGGRYPARK